MSRRRKAHFLGGSVKVPISACLGCGKRMDGASAVDHHRAPAPGSITICLRCGHLMAFADDMRLRALSDEEMIEIAGDPRVIAVQRARQDAATMEAMKGGRK